MTEKERILIVDDDPSILNLLGVALRQSGFIVATANNGFMALEILSSQEPFSVILIDLMMPGINGQELSKRVKEIDPYLEIIIITAAPAVDSAINTLRGGGAYDYLVKPFDSIGQLALTVERAAGHRRLRLERESLQKRLSAEAEWLQALIANTGDAILSGNADGIITVANPAAMRLIGSENPVGKPTQEVLPDRLAKLLENWQQVGGNHPTMMELPWFDRTVQLVTLTPVHDAMDRQGWVAVLRDVTHLKQLEELKMEMFIETAHKIHLPLAQGMNGLAELNEVVSQDQRAVSVLLRQVKLWERIQEWVDDMVALVHLSSDENIKLIDFDVQPVLVSQINKLQTAPGENPVREKNLRLLLEADRDLPRVHTDPDLLRRLLKGLVLRAAMRSEKNDTIRVRASSKDGQVWIEVCDNGPAIPNEAIPYVFAVTSFKPDTASLYAGLELAIAKTIMDRIGGQVWVGNQQPQGSVITICLQ